VKPIRFPLSAVVHPERRKLFAKFRSPVLLVEAEFSLVIEAL